MVTRIAFSTFLSKTTIVATTPFTIKKVESDSLILKKGGFKGFFKNGVFDIFVTT